MLILVLLFIGVVFVQSHDNILGINPTGYNFSICNWKTDIYDPSRPQHKIPLLNYYPCDHVQQYPIMIFGHASKSQDTWYDYIWKGLVPQGYIVTLLGSYEYEDSYPDFSRDQRFTLDWMYNVCNATETCALYQMIMKKSIASGHSFGGGASIMSVGNANVNESFEYEFDALMTLSGCGHEEVAEAAKNVSKPAFILSGSSDCICPPSVYADPYYFNDIPSTTCKYIGIITNGTHCHFGETGEVEDILCGDVEADSCTNKTNTRMEIPKQDQWNIVNEYFSLFMYAILYTDKNSLALNNISLQLQNDNNNGIMYQINSNCN